MRTHSCTLSSILLLVWAAAAALAQPTVAPTSPTTISTRGENVSEYNITNSFELGYRFREVGGDYGKYRSDVNFGNGVRLLGSTLTVNSRDGQGHWFDEILLNTQGLGNDPYQFASLRIQKNKLYSYDMTWRLNEYYNPALTISYGEHLMDTRQRLQDHNLILFPQSKFRVIAGYSRSSQTGPALSTINIDGASGNEFPLFANVRRTQDEYRLGGDATLFGTKLTVVRAWEIFKEDTPYSLLAPSDGNDPTAGVSLNQYYRAEPYHGYTPSWRVALFRNQGTWLSLNGRFTYAGTRRNFIQSESAQGIDFITFNRQILVSGTGERPVTASNLNLVLFPKSRLTITNQSSYTQIRMSGANQFVEVDDGSTNPTQVNFNLLAVRTLSNSTDLLFHATPWLGVAAGYEIVTRRIQAGYNSAVEDFTNSEFYQQNNILHAGTLGLRLRPYRYLTINVDGEIGRANHPFTPTSDGSYQAFGARAQYRRKSLTLAAVARTNYNFNSVSLSSYSTRSRQYSAEASWAPKTWMSFDTSFAKLHLDTVGGIAYFVDFNLVTGEDSVYVSNLYTGSLGVRFSAKKRADVFVGYNRIQDVGDNRASILGAPIGTSLPALQMYQTFPLSFDSPLARISVPIRPKLRWNAGYQHYAYHEEFGYRQNYRAHTGYTSVTWSF